MPAREHRDRSYHHSRSRSRSQERKSPNDAADKTEKAEKAEKTGRREKDEKTTTSNNIPSPQNKEQLDRLIRRMLTATLRRFDSGSDKSDGFMGRETRERSRHGHHERSEDRKDGQETRGPGPDNDLAKLVLGQVLQFTVRRYLKSREKKRLQAATKSKVKMTRMPVPLPIPVPGPGLSGPPGGLDRGTDRGVNRGIDRGMPAPSPYTPPPRQARVDRYNDLIDDRRERRERHMERERQDKLERQERQEHLDRHHDRYDYSPSLPRRVPREPLPKSSSLREYPRDARDARDIKNPLGDGDRPPLRRVRDSLPPRPLRPFPPESRPNIRPDISTQPPLDPPLPRQRHAVDDPPAPPLKTPPPHPFSWKSVPVYPPVNSHHDTPLPFRPKDKPTAKCIGDPLTPPISPQRPYVPLDDPSISMITPMDELAHALDELLVRLRRTDGLVYRAVCRPSLDEDGRYWYEQTSLREHASDLQRSLMRASAEARVMREAIRRRAYRDKDKFKVQEVRDPREQGGRRNRGSPQRRNE